MLPFFFMIEWNNLVNHLQLFFYFSIVPGVFWNSPSMINQNFQNSWSLLRSLPCLLVNPLSNPWGVNISVMQRMKEWWVWGGERDWLLVLTIINKLVTGLLRSLEMKTQNFLFFLICLIIFDFEVASVPRIPPG